VQADADADPVTATASGAVAAERSQLELVHSGAELVGLSERFYGGVFVGGIVFVAWRRSPPSCSGPSGTPTAP
jgi:hypothetical protein